MPCLYMLPEKMPGLQLCCGMILQFTSSFFPTDEGIVGNLISSCPGLRERERAEVREHTVTRRSVLMSATLPNPCQREGRRLTCAFEIRKNKTTVRTKKRDVQYSPWQDKQTLNPHNATDFGRFHLAAIKLTGGQRASHICTQIRASGLSRKCRC